MTTRFISIDSATYKILGTGTILLGILSIIKGFSFSYNPDHVTYLLGFVSLGLGIISIGIVLFAFAKSEDFNRNNIRKTHYQFNNIIDSLRDSRQRLFDYLDEFYSNLHTKRAVSEIKINRLRRHIEFATWDAVTLFRKAKILLEKVETKDQIILIRSLLILIRNLLKPKLEGILINRHIEQLIMATIEALDFDVIDEFQIEFLKLFSGYIGGIDDKHRDFREYLIRKRNQLRVRRLDRVFERFDIK